MSNTNSIEQVSRLLQQASQLLSGMAPSSQPIPQLHSTAQLTNAAVSPPVPIIWNPMLPRNWAITSTSQNQTNTTPTQRFSGAPGPMRGNSLVDSELRSNFSPYGSNPLESNRRRGRGRQPGARTSNERSWSQKFMCLPSSDFDHAPRSKTKLALAEAGLGQEVVTLTMGMTAQEVERVIRQTYSCLTPEVSFQLLTQTSPGIGGVITAIIRTGVHSASVINTVVRRQSIIYIRPDKTVLQMADSDDDETVHSRDANTRIYTSQQTSASTYNESMDSLPDGTQNNALTESPLPAPGFSNMLDRSSRASAVVNVIDVEDADGSLEG